MAIEKIFGIETEWSIIVPGREEILANIQEFNLLLRIVREFFQLPYVEKEVNWEACDDEREEELKNRLKSLKEMKENGGYLPNGARLYVDYPHLEYSTPECLTIKDLVTADKAGNCLMNLAAQKASEILGQRLVILKDNSDRKGHSFASHENYLLERKTFWRLMEFRDFADKLITFLVTRQILAGAGKLGIEKGKKAGEMIFQISQRADFINEIMGHGTTEDRNIINRRDEPHADPERFARLHLILGDANLCEWALNLRVGTTAVILKMLEDNFIQGQPCLDDPVAALKLISRDQSCSRLLKLTDGKKMTAIDIQEWYWTLTNQYAESHSLSGEEKDTTDKWGWTIKNLRQSPEELVGYLDWKTKEFLFNKLKGRGADLSALKTADVLYHDINPEKSLYDSLLRRGFIKRLITDEDIWRLVRQAPENTRAYLRGLVAATWPGIIDSWGSFSWRRPIDIPVEKDLTVFDRFGVIIDSPLMTRERAEFLFRKIQAALEAWQEV